MHVILPLLQKTAVLILMSSIMLLMEKLAGDTFSFGIATKNAQWDV